MRRVSIDPVRYHCRCVVSNCCDLHVANTAGDPNVSGGSLPGPARPIGGGAHIAAADIVQPRRMQRQKALNQYLKKHGVEAVLQYKASERRAAARAAAAQQQPSSVIGGLSSAAASMSTSAAAAASAAALLAASAAASAHVRCQFSEGGVKCGERGLPLTKYCRRHILEDRAQVLFKACAVEKSGVVCREPVPITVENATCVLHFELPAQRAYTQKVSVGTLGFNAV